jgi:hypothetical protein
MCAQLLALRTRSRIEILNFATFQVRPKSGFALHRLNRLCSALRSCDFRFQIKDRAGYFTILRNLMLHFILEGHAAPMKQFSLLRLDRLN